MHSEPRPESGNDSGAETDQLQWICHPIIQEPIWKSGALVLIVIGIGLLVSLSFRETMYGIFSSMLLATSQSRYFFPTRYMVDGTGVTVSHLASRKTFEWHQLKRFIVTVDGVFLSPFSSPHRLDAFRGIHLRCIGNRDEVADAIERQIGGQQI